MIAWASYDLASSVYFGIAPAVLLPLYFHDLLEGLGNPTAIWGMLASGAILVSSIAVLAVASAARKVSRLPLLAGITMMLVGGIALLGWNPGPSLLLAVIAYMLAQSCYFAATAIYESFLPDLLPAAGRQKLSGFGWAVGYLGGIVGILVILYLTGDRPQSLRLLQECFAVLAVMSALFFALALGSMHAKGFGSITGTTVARPLEGVGTVLRKWRRHKSFLLLLLGSTLVQSAISAVIIFTTPILSERWGQGLQDLLWLLLLVHILSVPSTIGWSHLMMPRNRILPMFLMLACWGLVMLLLSFGSGPWIPLAVVSVIGCCLGGTQSALRGLVAEAVGEGQSAAFFGLATIGGRAATALGPALFAAITLHVGETSALFVMLLVLAAGGALVLFHLSREPLPGGEGGTARLPLVG